MYITTYIYSQKLSPTFLWVSKFDPKLETLPPIFKITLGRWFFFCHGQLHPFQPQFDENDCSRSFDQVLTLSLRCPAQIYKGERVARVYGWMDGMGRMGWTGYEKCPSILVYTLIVYSSCIYILIYSKFVNNILIGFKI